jgi:hypothetical protein
VWVLLVLQDFGAMAATNGQLELIVVEKAGGPPLPCRIQLSNAFGRPWHPHGVHPLGNHFVFPGQITLELPLGNYAFEIERGPEYPVMYGHFQINHFAEDTKTVELHRHVDMAANGWWSGDLDVHRPPPDMQLLMSAEDLHVAQDITWSNSKNDWRGKVIPSDPLLQFDRNRYCQLMGGGMSQAGGTWLFLNLRAPMPLVGVDPEYPPPLETVIRAREKPSVWIDATRPYGWDLPTLVAAGQIDSIELAHGQITRDGSSVDEAAARPRDKRLYPNNPGLGEWTQQVYYQLLNCGLRIPPSAGSGSGLCTNPVGYNRVYVYVEDDFTYEKWWEGLKAGRVVITNGPLLQPNIEGHPPGYVFRVEGQKELELEIGLTLSTRDPITYLEVIQDGHVAQSIRFQDYAKTGRLPKLKCRHSGWFLIRAISDERKTYRFAMTGPYYVEMAYQPRISKQSAQYFLDWVYQRAKQITIDDPTQRQQVLEYHRKARDFWQGLVNKANAE